MLIAYAESMCPQNHLEQYLGRCSFRSVSFAVGLETLPLQAREAIPDATPEAAGAEELLHFHE
jgi:hypothetical protein